MAKLPFIFNDEAETLLNQLTYTGNLPIWLNGELIRNGPGLFQLGKVKLNHWFDGMAVLHKFMFENNKVYYQSKFLQSDAYLAISNNGVIGYEEFATQPNRFIVRKIIDLFYGKITDNNSVNIVKFDKYYLAMTETDHHVLIDPETLNIVKPMRYFDQIKYINNLAHPLLEYEKGFLYGLGIAIGKTSSYSIYKTEMQTCKRQVIAEIPTKAPSYMHSFAKTENFFILYENPLKLSLFKLFFANQPFIENYVWVNQAMKFIFVTQDGKIQAQIEHASCFCFHEVNAFEENEKVYLDLIIYPNADVIKFFYLVEHKVNFEDIAPLLYRYVFDLKVGTCIRNQLSDISIEFPCINNMYAQKAHNFIYAVASLGPGGVFNALVKLDLAAQVSHKFWAEDGCYPGEPVFVAKPNGATEDAGIIMSMVGNIKNHVSFLLLLDAISFTEVARVALPHILPMGLHGAFYSKS